LFKKIIKNDLQALKNIRKTIFCNILPMLRQNDILKKKVPCQKLLKIAEIFVIFENSNVDIVTA